MAVTLLQALNCFWQIVAARGMDRETLSTCECLSECGWSVSGSAAFSLPATEKSRQELFTKCLISRYLTVHWESIFGIQNAKQNIAKPNWKTWEIFSKTLSCLCFSVFVSAPLLHLCLSASCFCSSKTQWFPLITCHLCSEIMLFRKENLLFLHTWATLSIILFLLFILRYSLPVSNIVFSKKLG